MFASERRGHDKAFFRRKWTIRIAMVIAKRGAQATLRRALALRSAEAGEEAGCARAAISGLGPHGTFATDGQRLAAAG